MLSVGATYVLGNLKSGSDEPFGVEIDLKAKNLYTIYIEPAYVMGKTALYGKLAYITMKESFSAVLADTQEVITIDGPSTFTFNFNGTAYGVGTRTFLNKNTYLQVEFMTTKFNKKSITDTEDDDVTVIKPHCTMGTIGIGYKF